MRLSRAAFGVMIKFSDNIDTIQTIVDEIDLKWIELELDPEREIKIKESIKAVPYFEKIQRSWESASKMRTWINEKKKNLSERIQKEIIANQEESKKEKESAQVEKIEIIDINSRPSVSSQAF